MGNFRLGAEKARSGGESEPISRCREAEGNRCESGLVGVKM